MLVLARSSWRLSNKKKKGTTKMSPPRGGSGGGTGIRSGGFPTSTNPRFIRERSGALPAGCSEIISDHSPKHTFDPGTLLYIPELRGFVLVLSKAPRARHTVHGYAAKGEPLLEWYLPVYNLKSQTEWWLSMTYSSLWLTPKQYEQTLGNREAAMDKFFLSP